MKIIITESKYEEGILNYLKAYYYPDYDWGPELHSFYKEEVVKYGGIDFYINDHVGYDYSRKLNDGILHVYSMVTEPLYNLFGYKWVPIFKEWFEENTGLKVNEVEFADNEDYSSMKRIMTENQYNLIKEMEDDLISYESNFESGINILVIFESNPNYANLVDFFEEYGYGFYFPEQHLIIIDGEIFLGDDGLTMKDLKFIEAHEIAHLILNHNGPRSEKDEIEADLGAYILLKQHNMSTDRLVDEFYNRHGVEFDEELTNKVSKNFNI